MCVSLLNFNTIIHFVQLLCNRIYTTIIQYYLKKWLGCTMYHFIVQVHGWLFSFVYSDIFLLVGTIIVHCNLYHNDDFIDRKSVKHRIPAIMTYLSRKRWVLFISIILPSIVCCLQFQTRNFSTIYASQNYTFHLCDLKRTEIESHFVVLLKRKSLFKRFLVANTKQISATSSPNQQPSLFCTIILVFFEGKSETKTFEHHANHFTHEKTLTLTFYHHQFIYYLTRSKRNAAFA